MKTLSARPYLPKCFLRFFGRLSSSGRLFSPVTVPLIHIRRPRPWQTITNLGFFVRTRKQTEIDETNENEVTYELHWSRSSNWPFNHCLQIRMNGQIVAQNSST